MSYCKRDAGHTGPCAEGHQEHHAYGSRVHVPYTGPSTTESLGKACEHNDKLQAALDEARQKIAIYEDAGRGKWLADIASERVKLQQQVTEQEATISTLREERRNAVEAADLLLGAKLQSQKTIAQQAATISQLCKALYFIQWVPTDAPFCPACWATSSEGHKDDCFVDAALDKALAQ